MNIALTVLLIIVVLLVLLLTIGIFMKRGYQTHSEIAIHAPLQKVFGYLKQIKNQDNFNLWIMIDPNMHREFKGTDGTVGFVYAWNGNKQAGEGEQEIKAIKEGENIEMEIRFVRPFAGIAQAKMATDSLSDDRTRVIWNTSSTLNIRLTSCCQ